MTLGQALYQLKEGTLGTKDFINKVLNRGKLLYKKLKPCWPPVGWGCYTTYNHTQPVSEFGFSRGTPIDRVYIEKFLSDCSNDIHGHVLEFANRAYTIKFGHDIEISDVIDLHGTGTCANIIGDISNAPQIPSGIYDCVICTQVLGFVSDFNAAIQTLHRILKPGGVLLLTVPGIVARIGNYDWEKYGNYWGFTNLSVSWILEKQFGEKISVDFWGNMYAANAFSIGLAAEECDSAELLKKDPAFQVNITARAVK